MLVGDQVLYVVFYLFMINRFMCTLGYRTLCSTSRMYKIPSHINRDGIESYGNLGPPLYCI